MKIGPPQNDPLDQGVTQVQNASFGRSGAKKKSFIVIPVSLSRASLPGAFFPGSSSRARPKSTLSQVGTPLGTPPGNRGWRRNPIYRLIGSVAGEGGPGNANPAPFRSRIFQIRSILLRIFYFAPFCPGYFSFAPFCSRYILSGSILLPILLLG